jgi:hypothetical protein
MSSCYLLSLATSSRFGLLFLSLLLVHAKASHVAASYSFYLYDLPPAMVDVWPKKDVPLTNTSVWKHTFTLNEGFGEKLTPLRFYDTWQFALFRMFLSRMVRSAHRTSEPGEADFFVVPYDMGAEVYVDAAGEYRRSNLNPQGSAMLDFLSKQGHLLSKGCQDHVFFYSANIVPRRLCSAMRSLLSICRNATILTGEVSQGHQKSFPHLQAIPMVASYHWNEADAQLSVPAITSSIANKRYFVSAFGSANTHMPSSNKLRRLLFEQCRRANRMKLSASGHGFEVLCFSERFDPQTNRDTVDIRKILSSYEVSMFCLLPPGDTALRKGVFDAILAGCVPVLFTDRGTPHPMAQYSWHVSEEDISNAFVYVNASYLHILSKHNVIEHLFRWYTQSPDRYAAKQATLRSLAYRMQYSLPNHASSEHVSLSPRNTWAPPFQDAYDVTMLKIAERVTQARQHKV